MFGISYDTWKSTCQMYFNLSDGEKAAYLQWFPFTKLSSADEIYIASQSFYERYIKTGAFSFFSPMMHQSENYIQKGDGSFRDSALLSPILFLLLQAVGKEISSVYSAQRRSDIDVFYAGNYEEMRPRYKQDCRPYPSVAGWQEQYHHSSAKPRADGTACPRRSTGGLHRRR